MTVAKSSVRESEQNRSIQHGNGYLAEGMVLTCSAHAQQAHRTYALSKHSGNNTFNNYDIMDISCIAPSKMKLIYV